MKTLLIKLAKSPKKIFLLAALGALITCSLLLIIQSKLGIYFGMPDKTIIVLSILAFSLFWYSTACFLLFQKLNWKKHLKRIGIANLIYCGLTFVLLVYNYKIITPLDWIYFFGEIMIISFLVSIELRMVKG
ncbi:MAG: hypothetical protein IPO32_04790 [Crocinitomicaceae bacterium]|nr:hypothetical protein [Crocinitomicaceae bacterium]